MKISEETRWKYFENFRENLNRRENKYRKNCEENLQEFRENLQEFREILGNFIKILKKL